jgi:type I restriction-modification system DNA methylase subunit
VTALRSVLPHGVLFRGGAEERIRRKLLDDGHVDTVIGLPANLFYSTGIPVCILVLKKCKKPDDVLFIDAAEHFVKGKRQNRLEDEHIERIVGTYQKRREQGRYSRRVTMKEIVENGRLTSAFPSVVYWFNPSLLHCKKRVTDARSAVVWNIFPRIFHT